MTFLNTSLIRKSTLCLAVAMLSLSAIAVDFDETQRLANQGDAEAQRNLGLMYDTGEGVPQNYAKALEWYTKSANQGYSQAQYNLGLMYKNGEGVPQDYTKALELFQKAAN